MNFKLTWDLLFFIIKNTVSTFKLSFSPLYYFLFVNEQTKNLIIKNPSLVKNLGITTLSKD